MTKGFKNEMAEERCKHGMVRLWCGICQNCQPTVAKKETTKTKDKKTKWWLLPKKYPGILKQPYQMCGVRQCPHNGNNERCPQPVYGEYETLCFYHLKRKNRKIELS